MISQLLLLLLALLLFVTLTLAGTGTCCALCKGELSMKCNSASKQRCVQRRSDCFKANICPGSCDTDADCSKSTTCPFSDDASDTAEALYEHDEI